MREYEKYLREKAKGDERKKFYGENPDTVYGIKRVSIEPVPFKSPVDK